VEYVKWVSSGCPVGVQWDGGWACVCGVYVGGRAKASFERHSADGARDQGGRARGDDVD